MHSVLQVRWLGRVGFREALDLQRRLWAHCADNYLLLLEHHHVFTAGPSALGPAVKTWWCSSSSR